VAGAEALIEASAGMFWLLVLSLVQKFPIWLVLLLPGVVVLGFWVFFRYNRAYPLRWVWLWEKRHLELYERGQPELMTEGQTLWATPVSAGANIWRVHQRAGAGWGRYGGRGGAGPGRGGRGAVHRG